MDTQTPQQPVYEIENKGNKSIFIIIAILVLLAIGAGGVYLFMQQNKQPNSVLPTATTMPQPTQVISQTTITQEQPSPTTQIDETANWNTYTNTQYNFPLRYPEPMYILEGEDDSYAAFSYKPFSDDPYVRETVFEFVTQYKERFDALFNAPIGSDVPEAHNAVGVIVKKLGNLKVDGYDAVEYTRDGISNYDTEKDGGRGGIGYEHIIIVKKDESTYLSFTYFAESKEKIEERNDVFNKVIMSIQIN